jgi:hypothetical protein
MVRIVTARKPEANRRLIRPHITVRKTPTKNLDSINCTSFILKQSWVQFQHLVVETSVQACFEEPSIESSKREIIKKGTIDIEITWDDG